MKKFSSKKIFAYIDEFYDKLHNEKYCTGRHIFAVNLPEIAFEGI